MRVVRNAGRFSSILALTAAVAVVGSLVVMDMLAQGASATTISSFSATSSLPASGGSALLTWSTTASSCLVVASPAVSPGWASAPCSNGGMAITLPANTTTAAIAYTFTLSAITVGSPVATSNTTTTVQAASAPPPASSAPVSIATTENPLNPAVVGAGETLGVTFNQPVAVSSGFSLALTDGAHRGSIDGTNAFVWLSNGNTVANFYLTAAPHMSIGTSLSGVNLEILSQTGVSNSVGPWNLLKSGETDVVLTVSPPACKPINARVFGGTNCLTFGVSGPQPAHIFDVIARPTYDLPGPPNDMAPEVITECKAGSTDTVFDLNTGAQLGTEPCGTVWNEALLGNTTSNTLDYIPTSGIVDLEQVAVVETIPGSLYVAGTAANPEIVGATRSGNTVTFTFSTPVTCPAPSTIGSDAFWEAAQFMWYTVSGSTYVNNHASAITCPGSAGGTQITATWANASIGAPPPSGQVRFKFEGFGTGPVSGVLLIPTGGTSSPLAGEREVSQSFLASLS